MKPTWIILPVAALAVAACDSDSAPTGQVAATVDGKEITASEVTAETNGLSSSDPEQQKMISNLALDAIVSRTIVEQEVTERGLDKTPAGVMALNRARQLAMLELLRQDLAKNQPTISDQDAQRFINENRANFQGRTIAVVDQIAIPTLTQALVQEMEPIQTMAGIRQLLDARKIAYRSSIGTLDSLTMTGEVGRQIRDMAIGEVYIIPQGGGARINAIRSRESYPISDKDALDLAKTMLAERGANEAVNTALAQIVTAGKTKVKYAENFSAPTAPAAAGATAEGAPSAPAAPAATAAPATAAAQ